MEFENLVNSHSSASEQIVDSDQPICPPRQKKRRRRSYIDPALILEVFPRMEADVLCKVAELKHMSPSDVLALIPNASSAEIADLFTKLKGRSQSSPVREQHYKSRSAHRGDSKPSLLDELKGDIDDTADNRLDSRKYF